MNTPTIILLSAEAFERGQCVCLANSCSGTVDHRNRIANVMTKTWTRCTEWTPRTTNTEKLAAPFTAPRSTRRRTGRHLSGDGTQPIRKPARSTGPTSRRPTTQRWRRPYTNDRIINKQ